MKQSVGQHVHPAQLPLRRADFDALDALDADTWITFFWTDVRPIKGAAQWLDWRLCGDLSSALLTGDIDGSTAEVALLPIHGRLGQRRLLALGLGHSSETIDFKSVCHLAMKRALDLGAMKIVFLAPCHNDPRTSEDVFLAALGGIGSDYIEQIEAVVVTAIHD